MDTLVCEVSASLSYSSSYLWKERVVSESKEAQCPVICVADGGCGFAMVPLGEGDISSAGWSKRPPSRVQDVRANSIFLDKGWQGLLGLRPAS